MGYNSHKASWSKHRHFFFLRKPSSMKTAICLVVCCFLLNSRLESGNAAKMPLARRKSASFLEEANEHVGRNKRCTKWLGGCSHQADCCAHLKCQTGYFRLQYCDIDWNPFDLSRN